MRSRSPGFRPQAAALLTTLLAAWAALAGPVVTSSPLSGGDDVAAVGASALAGYSALGDSFQDRVEVRDIRDAVVRTITRAEMQALCPWLSLDGGPDGPSGLAFTSSGKQLFILVHDDTIPGDGMGSDAVLRYDIATNALSLFARQELFNLGSAWPHLAAAHFRAILYVGNGTGQIKAYLANSAIASGSLLATWTLPVAGEIHGLTVDRDTGTLFASTATGIYRTTLTNSFGSPPTWTLVATTTGIRGLAWADSYGLSSTRGLYILRETGPATSQIDFILSSNAYSVSPVTPVFYTSAATTWHSISARGDGLLLVGQDEDALTIRDNIDILLDYDGWMNNEFSQVVLLGRGLISPDGEPAGWVIDGDTIPTQPRFHPATPDAAGWVVFLLLTNDALNTDPLAQTQVRTVLTRYGGLATDNIKPSRTADGIFRHWIDPATGGVKGTWDPEYATLSTMKIVAAAARAMAYYPDDPQIAKAGSRIIFRSRDWDDYVRDSDDAMYFKGALAGGPDFSSATSPFHEGVIFVEQAAAYGGTISQDALAKWLNRGILPSASYLPGMPITGTANNVFAPTFISVYPALLTPAYRAAAAWQAQVFNIRWSNAAWTDDFGPRYSTVFSAGTTKSEWGGYHADHLGDHPGNLSTFTSLMGLCAFGDESPAAGAYHAYRRGARQTFRTGATILYRRSDVDRAYVPDSCGMPDVALGALALAEIIQPGTIDSILSLPYPEHELCPTDTNADTQFTHDDLYVSAQTPTDLNGDGLANASDVQCQVNWFRRHERALLTAR